MPNDLLQDLAPTGRLRVALNSANGVLAASRTTSERPAGVTIDLSRELARRLGLDVAFEECDTPGKALRVLAAGDADLSFFAVDPLRAQEVHFTRPYVEIECGYVARDNSPLVRGDDVDQTGCTVFVFETSAYDLYLTRTLRHATIVRVREQAKVLDAFLQHQGLAALAGIKPSLIVTAERTPGLRMLEGGFPGVGQAMALPRRCGAATQAYLEQFAQEMIEGGFIGAALERHGIQGARVATGPGR
ncbi:transporter substrate-binding domain-containing protein [Ramlibacter sp.]|uniref:transporter substrate-binding domain-containing protein n=1 Tax=Ramlibacter sp. TaxID=1917967 RepID=UPI003D10DF6B